MREFYSLSFSVPRHTTGPAHGEQPIEVLPRGRRVGLDSERRTRFGDRLVELPLQPIGDRQVAMSLAVSRSEFDHSPQMSDGLVQPILRTEQHREVEMRVGVLGIEGDRALVLANRLVRSSRRRQAVGEVEADAIVVRLAASAQSARCGVASASRPCICSTVPRLLCASASLGARRSASSRRACAS